MKSSPQIKAEPDARTLVSVVITVVHGKETVRRCVRALIPQIEEAGGEIIVPYDKWSEEVGELAIDFPQVKFHRYENLENASDPTLPGHTHRLYDRRRAVGLSLASGSIIAMTEDLAVPAADWVRQIRIVHEMPYEVIGGAVDNGIDRVMNWALYYCDFGRYGSPLRGGEAEYASDVNISYKRRALENTAEVWQVSYRETLVHWALRERGQKIYLDQRMEVEQCRPPIKFGQAFRERIEWGRMFAETRVLSSSLATRIAYGTGSVLLPPLLLTRIFRHMARQSRSWWFRCRVLPVVLLLLVGWTCGEITAYLFGIPEGIKHPGLRSREAMNV